MAQLWRKRRHHSRPSWYRSRVPLLLEVMADRHSLFDRSTLTATGYGRISALVVTARSVTPSPLKSLVTMTSDSVSAIKFRCHDRGIAHDELVGFDGLVNWRVPPIAQAVPKDVQAAICTLRQANPNIDVAVIVEHVAKYHAYKTSGTVVKREVDAGMGSAPLAGPCLRNYANLATCRCRGGKREYWGDTRDGTMFQKLIAGSRNQTSAASGAARRRAVRPRTRRCKLRGAPHGVG